MTKHYDVIVIGSGLGGLTAAALLARAGRKTLLVERNHGVGGAASTYKSGDLIVEAALHETSDPKDPLDPKHDVLVRAGVLDQVEWVPTGSLYEVRGGPVGEPFVLPEGLGSARKALTERFPAARAGIGSVLGDMEQIAAGLGVLSRGGRVLHQPIKALSAVAKLGPLVKDWRLSLGERLERAFGSDEAVKCAMAANLAYYHDDPDTLWWGLFAAAQGGYLASGGRYIRGGSQRLSNALARAFKAAGGELLLRRTVTEILFDERGRASGVAHQGRNNGERVEARAPVIVGNAAPAILAAMMPAPVREQFSASYERRPRSISLFSATFGLSVRPADLGFRSYSTMLLPHWLKRLADYRQCGDLLSGAPGGNTPILTVVDYSAIKSGIEGPPYPVSVVGVDRVANWSGLDIAAYEAKRVLWRDAIAAEIDRVFPGFASCIVQSVLSTASTMQKYLNAPDGAVYGFAPLPPSGPIWRGQENSPSTRAQGVYLASAFAGFGGFTGAILAGSQAVDRILAGT